MWEPSEGKRRKAKTTPVDDTYHYPSSKSIWCLMRDSNPQANALDPKSSVFTSFTNQALITFMISLSSAWTGQ